MVPPKPVDSAQQLYGVQSAIRHKGYLSAPRLLTNNEARNGPQWKSDKTFSQARRKSKDFQDFHDFHQKDPGKRADFTSKSDASRRQFPEETFRKDDYYATDLKDEAESFAPTMSRDLGTDLSDSEANSFSASLFTSMGDLFSTFWNKMMRDANLESWVVDDSAVSPPPSPLELLLTNDIQRAVNSTRDSLADIGSYFVQGAPLQQELDSEAEVEGGDGSKSDADQEVEQSPAETLDDQLFGFDKIDDSVIEDDSKILKELQREESIQNLDDGMTEATKAKENELAASGTKRKRENLELTSSVRDPRNGAFGDGSKKQKKNEDIQVVRDFDD